MDTLIDIAICWVLINVLVVLAACWRGYRRSSATPPPAHHQQEKQS